MKSVKNILLLDTDSQSAGHIINTLSIGKDSFAIKHAGGVTEGLSYLQNTAPDLVLLDGNMAELGDFAAVQSKLSEQNIPCILLSDKAGKNIIGLAEKTGAREYVAKSAITPSHLLKTIVSTLRLSETENRLNLVFEEYSGRISSFSQILDAFSAGAVVINQDGTMQYANAHASALLNDETLNKKLMPLLTYRTLKNAEVNHLPGENITIRTSQIAWDNQSCNLFIIEHNAGQSGVGTDLNLVFALLNAMHGQWVLLKDGMLEFTSSSAAVMLMQPAGVLKGRRIETLLSAAAFREIADTGGKSVKGAITLPDGSSLSVMYTVGNLNIGDYTYNLLGITSSTVSQTDADFSHQPAESMPDSISASAMGNFHGPTGSVIKDIQLMINCIREGTLDQAAKLAQLAESGVSEMRSLLGVFKEYLVLSGQIPEASEFSMKEEVEEAVANLQPKIEAAGAEINISELPTINADRGLVLQVLGQLLNNALQFSRHGKKPVIDIGHDKYEGSYIFCIRDNGIGISRKDHTRIFEPFAKLDPSDTGNGLGLAICKSITENHGGKIWVESLPGHGSNFYFTLG